MDSTEAYTEYTETETYETETETENSGEMEYCNLCNRGSMEYMLICDACDKYYHPGCANLNKIPNNNGKWFCDSCHEIYFIIRKHKKRKIRKEKKMMINKK